MRVKKFNPSLYLLFTLAIILLLTLLPNFSSTSNKLRKASLTPLHSHKTLICLVSSCDKSPAKVQSTVIDVVGNIALFIPFGTFASLRLKQRRSASWLQFFMIFGSAFLFSAAIEITQFWLPTRYTDIDDIIFNSSGALLGVVLVQLSNHKTFDFIYNPLKAGLYLSHLN